MFPKFDKVINDDPQPTGSTSDNTCINANVTGCKELLTQMLNKAKEAHRNVGFYDLYKKETYANQIYSLSTVLWMLDDSNAL